jgi:hypothetical protein
MDSDEKEIFSNDMKAILILTEAAYRDNFMAIKEINFMNAFFKMLKEGAL